MSIIYFRYTNNDGEINIAFLQFTEVDRISFYPRDPQNRTAPRVEKNKSALKIFLLNLRLSSITKRFRRYLSCGCFFFCRRADLIVTSHDEHLGGFYKFVIAKNDLPLAAFSTFDAHNMGTNCSNFSLPASFLPMLDSSAGSVLTFRSSVFVYT